MNTTELYRYDLAIFQRLCYLMQVLVVDYTINYDVNQANWLPETHIFTNYEIHLILEREGGRQIINLIVSLFGIQNYSNSTRNESIMYQSILLYAYIVQCMLYMYACLIGLMHWFELIEVQYIYSAGNTSNTCIQHCILSKVHDGSLLTAGLSQSMVRSE